MKIVPENDVLSDAEARLVREFRAVPEGSGRFLAFEYMKNLQRNCPRVVPSRRPVLRLVDGPGESA